ncbi:LANO_0C00364g1_1 [Lachancea nothofagi CBS 11611]|uniref:LANO_0C00364g1_1 n=1 Tax=Lachancea nothofagi CBS 11611 TaxID=1266666 RepID=A0A1G4J2Z0_9SACH|nr:LANO_0C00364g1_1 [Lachancea nothofagi CBS 11611]
MRKVLACEKCRTSKIKCRHQGSAPCDACRGKSYGNLCILSLPVIKKIPKSIIPVLPESSGFKDSEVCSPLSTLSNLPLSLNADFLHRSPRSSSEPNYTRARRTSSEVNNTRKRRSHRVRKPETHVGSDSEKERSVYESFSRTSPVNHVGPTPINLLLSRNLPSDPEMLSHPERSETMSEVISQIPEAILRLVITQTSGSFPELAFLHMPSLLHDVKKSDPLITGALLDLFTSFNRKYDHGPYREWLGPGSRYVKEKLYGKIVIREAISPKFLLYRPSIEVVQALIILALSYWGKGDYFMCWMLHGNASRMLQAFGFCFPPSGTYNEDASYVPDWTISNLGELDSERLNRTYWSCFMIDRITAFGNNRSFAFSKSRYEKVPLPHDMRTFTLMTNSTCAQPVADLITTKLYNNQLGNHIPRRNIGEHAIYIKIFSIWGEINEYLMQGGRYTQTLPPWDDNSLVYKIRGELKKWWELLPIHWRWTTERLTLHRTMGTDTIFSMSNCLYHLCITYINREHLPFLPHSIQCPSGPTEEPLLSDPLDKDYWKTSATECFQSTRSMCIILNTLIETENKEGLEGCFNSRTTNVFYCFCAFVASIESMYGTKFHWMNPTRNSNTLSLETCYLQMFNFLKAKQDTVKIAQNWLEIANRVMELYEFVAKNREQAAELNLGRNNLRQLVDLIQLVNTGITRESIDHGIQLENTSARRELDNHIGDFSGFNIEDLNFFLNEDVNILQQFTL